MGHMTQLWPIRQEGMLAGGFRENISHRKHRKYPFSLVWKPLNNKDVSGSVVSDALQPLGF